MTQRDVGEELALSLTTSRVAKRFEWHNVVADLAIASRGRTKQGTYMKGQHVVTLHAFRGSGDVLAAFTRWGTAVYYRGDGWAVCACLLNSGYVLHVP